MSLQLFRISTLELIDNFDDCRNILGVLCLRGTLATVGIQARLENIKRAALNIFSL